jgi:hypothetical protein
MVLCGVAASAGCAPAAAKSAATVRPARPLALKFCKVFLRERQLG